MAIAARPSVPTTLLKLGRVSNLPTVWTNVLDGAAEQQQRQQAVVGETPNLAARLQALAEPGAVVIAASTHPSVSKIPASLLVVNTWRLRRAREVMVEVTCFSVPQVGAARLVLWLPAH